MGKNGKNNNAKMSLGDFMGGAPSTELSALPTGPKQRSYVRKRNNHTEEERAFVFMLGM